MMISLFILIALGMMSTGIEGSIYFGLSYLLMRLLFMGSDPEEG